MLSPTPLSRHPLHAGPVRRLFHGLVALAGWGVFLYGWSPLFFAGDRRTWWRLSTTRVF